MASRTYLDHNATTPVRPQVIEAMISVLGAVGNPSSVHAEGRAARAVLEKARADLATLVNARPADVFFTSGATEALNLVLTPSLQVCRNASPFARLLLSAVEHPAALKGHRFPLDAVETVAVDSSGLVDMEKLESQLSSGKPSLVAVQLANNETGVIQPIAAIAECVRRHSGALVCDAAQGLGKIPLDVKALGADLYVFSAHKCGGPTGVGAVVRGNSAAHVPDAVLKGGGQEKGWRAGTENSAGIAGFGVACQMLRAHISNETDKMARLRDAFEAGLYESEPDVEIYGAQSPRLPTTLAFSVPDLTAEEALMLLDLEGIAVSSGSACSSGKVRASHVLAAMGVSVVRAANMLRISIGWNTAPEDVDRFLSVWRSLRGRQLKAGSA